VSFWQKNIGAKAAFKMLMKLTTKRQGTIEPTFYEQLFHTKVF